MQDKTRVTTPVVRIALPHLDKPWAGVNSDGAPKYSLRMIWPKSDTHITELLKDAEAAAREVGKDTKWGGSVPRNLRPSMINDDDITGLSEDYPEYAGMMYLNVSTSERFRPGVVDRNLQPMDPASIYAGCYARVSLRAVPYKNQSSGITFSLNGVQFVRDGEPLGGGSANRSTADMFDDGYNFDDVADEDLI